MKIIIHVDMNSYFASVEQQANPLLRGKPIGVCAYLPKAGSNKGCVIASSREAKAFGVKTGFPVYEARRLCPNIILIENDPAKYRSTTAQLYNIYQNYTDRIETYSIDEVFLDMTGLVKNFDKAKELADEIKERIHREVGEWINCSVGIAPTRWLAKFAGDVCEKNGILSLDNVNKIEEVFKKVKLTDAWGIAEAMQARLNCLGIYNLMDLKKYPVANLMRSLGKMGYYLWANVNGLETDGVRTQEELTPKSIGHSYCLPKQTNDPKYISAVLMKLCDRAGVRLRSQGLEAMKIFAGYTLINGGSNFESCKLKDPLFSSRSIFEAAWSIVGAQPISGKVRMLAISISSLRPYSGQLSFFQNRQKEKDLALSLDKINRRFGEYSIYAGRMFGMENQALDRVGFRKTVEIESKILN